MALGGLALPLLRTLDAETAHGLTIRALKAMPAPRRSPSNISTGASTSPPGPSSSIHETAATAAGASGDSRTSSTSSALTSGISSSGSSTTTAAKPSSSPSCRTR